MAELSSAAQAVRDNYGRALFTKQYTASGRIEIAIAAALHAAADQVVPMALCVYNDDFAHVRHQLHAIADELDAHLGQTR